MFNLISNISSFKPTFVVLDSHVFEIDARQCASTKMNLYHLYGLKLYNSCIHKKSPLAAPHH